MLNALTIDVEDYFHVSAFSDVIDRSQWDSFEQRVETNTNRLLDILAEEGTHATFFVLGWVADRHPRLIRRIHEDGHELASHSYHHELVYRMTPDAFRDDLRRARHAIEDAASTRVLGFRAPSYSITADSLWALDVLIAEGYTFDSSIYPIHHDRYGIPTWNRSITRVMRPHGSIWEVPGSTVRRFGVNLPIGGGGYFRLLPYSWTSRGIASLNQAESAPATFYLHPWEIDPGQPRIKASLGSRIRHYHNLRATEKRFRTLLREFNFGPISRVLENITALREGPELSLDGLIGSAACSRDESRPEVSSSPRLTAVTGEVRRS
jgi:polysaccharide deacetylase family protein (PEP-CTERM system associated)